MSERLGTSDIARLLDISRPRVWQLRKQSDFPEPAGKDNYGHEYWLDTTIWRWLARSGRALASKAPVLYREVPTGAGTARFLGATTVDQWVVLSWDTALGLVAMTYPIAHQMYGPAGGWHSRLPGADVVVEVTLQFDLLGPELKATDRVAPKRTYSPKWSELTALFGSPPPWWPPGLRRAEEMTRWVPGAPQVTTPAIPDVDIRPLLTLANDEPDESTTRRALLYMARTIQSRSTETAARDVTALTEFWDTDALVIAAVPAPTQEPEDDVPEWILRDGWAQVLRRTDQIASECVRAAAEWDSGTSFPFSVIEKIHLDESPIAREWRATLKPTERTAAFDRFSSDDVAVTWTDPATDAPVAEDENGELKAGVPQVLPATAPLSEVVLEAYTVWIRTEDGQLYLAPQSSGNGLSYGYSGSGPLTLTRLVDRLLDDINAPAQRTYHGEPPAGLRDLFTHERDDTAVLTRAELLAARQP